MTGLTVFELEVAQLIVESLNLTVLAEDVEPDKPLFNEGLGLDSIDALEIGLMLQGHYGINLKSDSEETRRHFVSLNTLAALVDSQRTK